MVFGSTHQCLSPSLLVFKLTSSVYLRNISLSGSDINWNCDLNGMAHKALCSLPAGRANPLPILKITVLSSWSGWLVPNNPSDRKRSSSVAVNTLALFTIMPIPCHTLAFIVLSSMSLRSLNAGSLIILKAKPMHSKWNCTQTTTWYSVLPGKSSPFNFLTSVTNLTRANFSVPLLSWPCLQDHTQCIPGHLNVSTSVTHGTFSESIISAS